MYPKTMKDKDVQRAVKNKYENGDDIQDDQGGISLVFRNRKNVNFANWLLFSFDQPNFSMIFLCPNGVLSVFIQARAQKKLILLINH